MAHVFISYKHDDRVFASSLRQEIESQGFEVWMDDDLLAGDDWRAEIDTAIYNAFAAIVVVSPEAKSSEYVTYEWACAFGAGKKIIPLLIRPTNLHPRLEALQYLDFSKTGSYPWDDLFRRLAQEASSYFSRVIHIPRNASPAVRKAAEALDSYDPSTRRSAINSLSSMKDNIAHGILVASLQSPTADVRMLCAVQLVLRHGFKEDNVTKPLLEAVISDDADLQLKAIKAVAKIQSLSAVPLLINLLTSQAAEVEQVAVSALGEIGDPSAIPPLLDLLDPVSPVSEFDLFGSLFGKSKNTSREMTTAVIKALEQIGTVGVPKFISELQHRPARTRIEILRIIGKTESNLIEPALIKQLGDETPDVRGEALRILGERKSKLFIDRVNDMLEDTAEISIGYESAYRNFIRRHGSRDLRICDLTVIVLGQVGGDTATQTLAQLLVTPDRHLAEYVLDALNEIDNQSLNAISIVFQEAGSNDRLKIVRRMGKKISNLYVEKWLLQVLEQDRSSQVRSTTLEILSKSEKTEVKAVLRKYKQ